MALLTFYADHGQVWMADGPWSSRLTQSQADTLLSIWDECGAVSSFNQLYAAVQAAGYLPPIITSRALRRPVLVVDNEHDVARHQFTQAMENTL